MGMCSSAPELSQEEKDLLRQVKESGASETEIAKLLSQLGVKSWEKGQGLIDTNTAKNAGLESILNSIMKGEQSFVDDKYAQKLYSQARENAANEYAGADAALSDKFARRGLFGGGQQAAAVRGVATDKARALASQATDIYSQQAQAKAVERASALDALMNSMNTERNVGLSLTGMGGGNLGQSANAYQGVGTTMGNMFGSSKLRPGPGWGDRALAVAGAVAKFIPWCSFLIKNRIHPADAELCYDQVKKVEVRLFHYDDDTDMPQKEFTGFIIEDIPDNWRLDESALDLLTITGTLVATIQMLQKKVERLEAENQRNAVRHELIGGTADAAF